MNSQEERIREKASKLGFDGGNSDLSSIASELGIKNFNPETDLNRLENKIDNLNKKEEIQNNIDNDIENLYQDNNLKNDKEKFREEFSDKIDDVASDYIEDSTHIPKNVAKKAVKNNGGAFAPGNTPLMKGIAKKSRNNIADKVFDIKNKAGLNKGDNEENEDTKENEEEKNTLNDKKNELKNIVNQNKKEALKKKAKEAGKQGAKVTGKAVLAFIKSNPWILAIIAAVAFFIFLILVFTNFSGSHNTDPYTVACDGMSLTSTSLSREDFISGVTNYFSSHNRHPGASVFIENAGTIYDISTTNNINPELVVVRALREGFSPSGNKDTLERTPILATYNNYWGLGCSNGASLQDACESFQTFDLGLLGFIENLHSHGYTTVSNMMSKYSYIGHYWYNNGTGDNSNNAGLGGCYYFDGLKEYMSDSQISRVEKACAVGVVCTEDDTTNCTPTTDEDQQAYTKYQVNEMVKTREYIFGIPKDVCTNYDGDCAIYGQSDPRWKNIMLGNSNSDMGNYGCAVTSLAIAISCADTPITIQNYDAGEFLKALNAGNCFDGSGQINWYCSAIREVAPEVSFVGSISVDGDSNQDKINLINSYNPDEYFILLHYYNYEHRKGHFVVYTAISGDKFFTVKDPAYGGIINNVSISEIVAMKVFRYKGVENG